MIFVLTVPGSHRPSPVPVSVHTGPSPHHFLLAPTLLASSLFLDHSSPNTTISSFSTTHGLSSGDSSLKTLERASGIRRQSLSASPTRIEDSTFGFVDRTILGDICDMKHGQVVQVCPDRPVMMTQESPPCCSVDAIVARIHHDTRSSVFARASIAIPEPDLGWGNARMGLQIGNIIISDVVKWFDNEKDYGSITLSDNSVDVLAHFSSIVQESGRRTLFEGEQIEFDITQDPKDPQAENIQRLV